MLTVPAAEPGGRSLIAAESPPGGDGDESTDRRRHCEPWPAGRGVQRRRVGEAPASWPGIPSALMPQAPGIAAISPAAQARPAGRSAPPGGNLAEPQPGELAGAISVDCRPVSNLRTRNGTARRRAPGPVSADQPQRERRPAVPLPRSPHGGLRGWVYRGGLSPVCDTWETRAKGPLCLAGQPGLPSLSTRRSKAKPLVASPRPVCLRARNQV